MVDRDEVINVPQGWAKLFLQMCDDIEAVLTPENTFEFIQVKEKFSQLRIYYDCSNPEVKNIISKYEYVSEYICEFCGKPATKQPLEGWIYSVCDECGDASDKYVDLNFNLMMHIIKYDKDNKTEIEIDCSDIWERYRNGK